MKKRLQLLLILLLFANSICAQVGIGTDTPLAMLDINGTLRVQATSPGSINSARDSIAVLNGNGIVHRVPAREVLNSLSKTVIKGGFSGTGTTSISLNSNWVPLAFNFTEFDTNSEYNTNTHIFTAKSDGIYGVDAKMTTNAIYIGEIGLGLFKINLQTSEILVTRDVYSNLIVLGIAVNPPSRSIHTMVHLKKGERLQFKSRNTVSISLLQGNADTFFTIEQITFN